MPIATIYTHEMVRDLKHGELFSSFYCSRFHKFIKFELLLSLDTPISSTEPTSTTYVATEMTQMRRQESALKYCPKVYVPTVLGSFSAAAMAVYGPPGRNLAISVACQEQTARSLDTAHTLQDPGLFFMPLSKVAYDRVQDVGLKMRWSFYDGVLQVWLLRRDGSIRWTGSFNSEGELLSLDSDIRAWERCKASSGLLTCDGFLPPEKCHRHGLVCMACHNARRNERHIAVRTPKHQKRKRENKSGNTRVSKTTPQETAARRNENKRKKRQLEKLEKIAKTAQDTVRTMQETMTVDAGSAETARYDMARGFLDRIHVLTGRVQGLEKDLQNSEAKYKEAREELSRLHVDETIDELLEKLATNKELLEHCPDSKRVLLLDMARNASKKAGSRRYRPDTIRFALSLLVHGPAAYKGSAAFLTLPTRGYIEKLSQALFKLGVGLTAKRVVANLRGRKSFGFRGFLMMDECSISSGLVVIAATGRVVGYDEATLPKNPFLCLAEVTTAGAEAKDVLAKKVFVFYVHSFTSASEHFVVGEHYCSGYKGADAASLICEYVQLLDMYDLRINAVVSDGASNNRLAYSILGGAGGGGAHKNFFIHPNVPDEKVYLFFDWPHICKRFYTLFLTARTPEELKEGADGVQVTFQQRPVSFTHLRDAWRFSEYFANKGLSLKLLPGIRKINVYPNPYSKQGVAGPMNIMMSLKTPWALEEVQRRCHGNATPEEEFENQRKELDDLIECQMLTVGATEADKVPAEGPAPGVQPGDTPSATHVTTTINNADFDAGILPDTEGQLPEQLRAAYMTAGDNSGTVNFLQETCILLHAMHGKYVRVREENNDEYVTNLQETWAQYASKIELHRELFWDIDMSVKSLAGLAKLFKGRNSHWVPAYLHQSYLEGFFGNVKAGKSRLTGARQINLLQFKKGARAYSATHCGMYDPRADLVEKGSYLGAQRLFAEDSAASDLSLPP